MKFASWKTTAAGHVATVRQEMRSHALGYSVLCAFMLAGPVATHFLFPDAPTGLGLVGGIAFGAYAALCAVPEKFI